MIRSLHSSTVETYLMDDIDFSTLVNGATVAYTNGTTTIYSNNEYHFATADIGENAYFVSKQKSATLFAPLSHIKSKVFITGLFSILVFLLIVYLIVVRFASKELMNLERRQFVLEKVANEANIDPLTKAGSRNKGTNNLEQAFKDYISSGISPAVMLFDIDNFKSINDMYGHYAGDIVLIEVINAVTEVIRRDDRLFRWGGDEFVGIFSGINEDNAESIAAKIGDAVYNLQIDVGNSIILPTISIGVSFFNYDDVDFSNALKRADQAMYISKSEGRNKVSIM
ncbi:MAG: GGDEF domain-containing protein [Gudongella sp.]|jgi:diguanylate cyclase (GGDEF)-like protein|nr:GGDEF domain-containing protein [Gudongella sp.]